jgi:hypothetical protein
MKSSGFRACVEAGIALLTGALCVLTVVWLDWIEVFTGWDPDRHDGSLEWLIVGVLLVIAVVLGWLARCEWRQRAAATEQTASLG